MKHIVIIGGGISGLAAAHRLTELSRTNATPVEITLCEASDRLGGIIQTHLRDGFLLERGPDSFISEKPEAIRLAQRLGIDRRLITTNEQHRCSFIVRKGRLRKVPEGFQLLAPSRFWPFISTDIFSLPGKLRMAADLFLPRANSNGSTDESLASFVTRRLGKEALDRMAQPMVGGIYTADPGTLSLRATLPRFLDMEREHRSIILAMLRQGKGSKTKGTGVSGPRYSLFLSFDSGMQVLTDQLERTIKAAGVRIQLNSKVTSLDHGAAEGPRSWTITTNDGSQIQADGVCLAVPSYSAAILMERIDAHLAQQLRAIDYTSTATINFAYRRDDVRHSLDGFGFVVPLLENRSLIACTFSSVKFPGRAPEQHVLLRAFVGGALQPEIFQLDETEMVERVKSDLNQLLDIQGQPLFVETSKWSGSMPQYYVGHLERISAIETQMNSLPGVSVAGNSYRGAGLPDCIRSGETAAEKLFDSLSRSDATD
ncbi:MAG TPA: protoporphyrinogen oxidase [Pyrinomonadaceae bacterium]|nr:protoporphyrinogen oxidase [Pyrinomonadaceae bacterium]